MRASRPFLAGLTVLLAVSCQAPPPPDEDHPAAATAGPGTPNPPFQGAVPKGAQSRDVSGRYGGALYYPTVSNPKTFNLVLANETSTTDVIEGPVFRRLLRYDRVENELEGDLVESWSHTPDFKQWTFTLREGLLWSDGHPITSDDVAFSWQAIMSPGVLSALRSGLTGEDDRPFAFEKIDQRSFRIVTPGPNVHLYLSAGEIPPLPRHVLGPALESGKFSSDAFSVATPPSQIVVSGPYRVKEYLADQKIVLERNPYYHAIDRDGNRLPYVDQVVFIVTPNFDTSLLKFKSGEVDSVEPYVYSKDYAELKERERQGGYKVYEAGVAYNSNFWWLNQNPGKRPDGTPYVDPRKLKWFRNQKFRTALSHATDREGMVRTICLGLGQPLWSHVTPANVKWANPDVTRYPYDLDRSRAILEELGFQDRDGDGLREDPEGNPFSFTINTNSGNTNRIRVGSILVDDLKKIGLKAVADPIDFNALVEKMRSTYDYEAAILGLSSAVPPHPMLGKNVYLSSGITHYWHPNQRGKPGYAWEARIDELMGMMDKTESHDEQKKHFDEVLAIMAEQAVWATTYVENYYVAVKERVMNLQPVALRPSSYHNIEELWVRE